jgi:hypothetical protein
MPEVPRTITPVKANEATALLVTALRDKEGKNVERVAQHLLALVWIETGGGKLVCHNWGNLAGDYQGNFWRPPWYELSESSSPRQRELHQRMLDGKAPSKFRAYESRILGLVDFVRLLYSPRYAPMLAAARKGDTAAFAAAVHDTGYCPDDECRGERTLASYEKLTDKLAPLFGLEPRGGGGSWSGIGMLVVLYLLAKGGRRLF